MNKTVLPVFTILLILFSACSSSTRFTGNDHLLPRRETKKETDKPSGNKREFNDTSVLRTVTGVASYYGPKFNGNPTSSGEIFNMNDLTAAHRVFPFNTILRVTNLDNSKSVIVRINDRGPFNESRIIDLSLGAAKIIDMVGAGTAKVKLEVLKWGE